MPDENDERDLPQKSCLREHEGDARGPEAA